MKVGLSFGSNLGDRLRHLQRAKEFLLGLSLGQWCLAAPLFETDPVGCPPGSPAFLNTVLEIEFTGTPAALWEKLLAYENAHGRDRHLPRNSARNIDIDVLYFGEQEFRSHDLVIPHPRLAERRFVLVPLATIRPDLIIQGTGRTVRQLLRELPEQGGAVKFFQQDW